MLVLKGAFHVARMEPWTVAASSALGLNAAVPVGSECVLWDEGATP